MSRTKKTDSTEIHVRLVFDGKQDSRQIFIGLMLEKAGKNAPNRKSGLEPDTHTRYHGDKVFSDARVG